MSFCFFAAGSPEISTLLLDLLVVFGSAKLLAELAERLGQPPVVGELLAGVLIGPAVLGWIQPSDLLAVLAELGVMFLLFRVGLELQDFRLTKIGFDALLVAILGVILPFLAGWGIMAVAGYPQMEGIFVGAALVATSVGITARVLAAKGLLQERASKIILAAAIIDDVLGLLVLAAVSSVAKGGLNLVELGVTTVLAVGFTLVVATWGTRTMTHMVPRVEQRFRSGGGEFTLSMLMLFGLSLVAVYAGVAAIIGAFLAGMALADSASHKVHDMISGVTELLVPFFLVGIGLHLDVSIFANPRSVMLALIILVAACLTKFVGCGLGAIRFGRADMARVGVGMIPRGEVGMVVAQIGLGLHVVGKEVYALVVFMAIASTIIAPPLLNLAFRGVTPHKTAEEVPRLG